MGPNTPGPQNPHAVSTPSLHLTPTLAGVSPPRTPVGIQRPIVGRHKISRERDHLIASHMSMATRMARSFAGRGEDLQDLTQVAMLALVAAANRYDPARGVTFAQYAQPCILGDLKKHFRDKGWNLRVPRRMQELYLLTSRAIPLLTQTLGRAPTISDIAIKLHLPEADIRDGVRGQLAYRTHSLDMPTRQRDDSDTDRQLGRLDDDLERVPDRHTLGTQVARLPARQQTVLRLRFIDDLTQREIADRIGLSQMQVSRLLTRSMDALRTMILAES